jgi:hypothetical protein
MKTLYLTVVCALALAVSAIAAEPVKRKTDASVSKALTYGNVVTYFKESGLPTTEVQKRCTIFFEGEWKGASVYSYCLIIVENSDEDVQVTFYLTDAHEMIWVNEFLDSPFFSNAETQKLLEVSQSRREVRRASIGHYTVDFHKWEPRHAQILVFSFTRH